MPSTLREGIQAFLNHVKADSPFLIDRYYPNLETQVMVHAGVQQDESGRAYVDSETGQRWSDARWPYDAGTNPNYRDRELTYSPAQHCKLIGTSWWDYERKVSIAVGLDIDVDEGHAESTTTVTMEGLEQVKERLLRCPYTTLVHSKSGKGLHCYVFFNPDDLPVAANHHEHKQHALAVIEKISQDIDYDIGQHIDTKGLMFWIWAEEIGEGGLTLIRDFQEQIGARDLEGFYKERIYEPTRSVSGYTEDGSEVEQNVQGEGQQKFSLDEDHKKILKALEETDYECIWIKDYNMMQTHTVALAEVHKRLDLKGKFETVSGGERTKPNWEKVNCYITPRERGAFKVTRFGEGIAEHDFWTKDEGKTFCFYNAPLNVIGVLRKFASSVTQTGIMKFERGALQQAVDLIQDEPQTIPDDADGPISVKVTKEGGIVCNNKKWEDGLWLKYVIPTEEETATLPDGFDEAENMARFIISEQGDPLGWAANSSAGWLYPVKDQLVTDRLSGRYGKDMQGIRNYLSNNPWTMVNRPFQEEYPGDRVWNHRAPQFKIKPSEEAGSCPHWDKVFDHLGQNLTSVVRATEWCQRWGFQSGADYLRFWVAALIKYPFEPLPYLFFYGKQETGKSVFHEMLNLVITNGVMRANGALTNSGGFNGELRDAFMCYIEELDLAAYKQAYDKIKEYTTARNIQIHIKGVTPFMQPNKLHFVQMSNSSTHCPIEDGDSRIVVIEVPELTTPIPKSILEKKLREEAPYFLNQILSIDLPAPLNRLRIPVLDTDAKEDLEKGSFSPVQEFCHSALFECAGQCVKVSELYEKYVLHCQERAVVPESAANFRNQLSPTWVVGKYTDKQNHVANVSLNPRERAKKKRLALGDNGRLSLVPINRE